MFCSILYWALVLLLAALSSAACFAAEPVLPLELVVVTATSVEQSAFDLPAAIDSLNQAQLQEGQLQVNLSETMTRIPGIVAQNRQNYAQDLQISSRGFGARASFGVRGLRLYADGIPATMPDGQGQVSHFDLGSAARLEVLRGPFSSLYGNSSGGVISLFTEKGKPGTQIAPSFTAGSFGTQRLATKLSGDNGTLNYVVNAASLRTNGYRDHSAARRDNLNGKFNWRPDAESKLTLTVNALSIPEAQDPLGLSRAQLVANQRQVDTVANSFNTRKSLDQQQLGLTYERKIGFEDKLDATIYLGQRGAIQFQAIPIATQAPATHPGGVIDLKRDYWGIDTRWTHRGALANAPLTMTAGINYDKLDEARRGFQNFIGTQTGVLGALRRKEDNNIHNLDQYVQMQWEPSEQWLLMSGLRHSTVKAASVDKYVVGANGDDSGTTSFSATTPVLGVTWHALPALNVYVSLGKGFETPTINEISYKPNGATGLNLDLKAAESDNLEVGMKTLLGESARLNVALFDTRTRNEIVTASNSGGRATFQNVGGTRRNGLEVNFDTELGNGFSMVAAYSWLKAIYTETFRSCRATGCTAATSVAIATGNRIPGIPANTLYGELSWKHPASGFTSALELRQVSQVFVDDQNSDAASAYVIGNLHLGFGQKIDGWRLKEFLRVDNFGDCKYAGSVIVNDGNGRFFEPASRRNWLLGLSSVYSF